MKMKEPKKRGKEEERKNEIRKKENER